jgi:hypothetical protein
MVIIGKVFVRQLNDLTTFFGKKVRILSYSSCTVHTVYARFKGLNIEARQEERSKKRRQKGTYIMRID